MKKSPAKLKIVCATSMVVFSLFAAFAGSIAWFSAAQNVSNGGNDFAVSALTAGYSITINGSSAIAVGGTYDSTNGYVAP